MKQCEVCGRTNDEVQINYCSKWDKMLCHKHRDQLERHGQIQPDDKPVIRCEVCGVSSNETTVYNSAKYGRILCGKHISQMNRLGKILPRTKRDPNLFQSTNEETALILKDKDENVHHCLIDKEDLEKCLSAHWFITEMMGNSRYVKSIINGKNTGLHRFVMNAKEGEIVDHINRDGTDNRKSNLRIVTGSENCTNSKTRSATGEKNIYFKNRKYQVQIIRKYECVFCETYATLGEAVQARDGFIKEYNMKHHRVV